MSCRTDRRAGLTRTVRSRGVSLIKRFDHVGITVADLDAVTAFFVGLGLEVEGRTFVEGEFVDTVTGIPDVRTEIVMLRPPGGDGERAVPAQRGLRGRRRPRSGRPAGRGRVRPRRWDR